MYCYKPKINSAVVYVIMAICGLEVKKQRTVPLQTPYETTHQTNVSNDFPFVFYSICF